MNDTTAGTTSGGGQDIKERTKQNAWQASYPSNWHTDNEMKRSCLSWINAGVFWNQWKCYLRNCISFVLSSQSAQPSSMLKNTFRFFIGIEPIDGFVFSLTIHFKLLNSNETNVSIIFGSLFFNRGKMRRKFYVEHVGSKYDSDHHCGPLCDERSKLRAYHVSRICHTIRHAIQFCPLLRAFSFLLRKMNFWAQF